MNRQFFTFHSKGLLTGTFCSLFLALDVTPALAGPCCGGSSTLPSILTGDDRAQILVSYGSGRVIGDAPAQGLPVFRASQDEESTETFKIDTAILISDRWQAGMSLPLIRRTRQTPQTAGTSAGLGDPALTAAFEWLPEWEYSSWKPKGFIFGQLTLPWGGSVYDNASSSVSDPWILSARGKGFTTAGLGALFVKGWTQWDTSLSFEAHHSGSRQVSLSTRVQPSWGASIAGTAGYTLSSIALRVGVSIGHRHEGPIEVLLDGEINPSQPQLVWDSSLQLAYSPSSSATINAILLDQTLLGPAQNTALNRSIAFSYQKRWER